MGGIACWNALMHENVYMVQKWNEFVAAWRFAARPICPRCSLYSSTAALRTNLGALMTQSRHAGPAEVSAVAGNSRRSHAWLQAAPLTAVFVVFFQVPLALILMVSRRPPTTSDLAFTAQVTSTSLPLRRRGSCVMTTYLSTLKFSC